MNGDRKRASVSGFHVKKADNGGFIVRHDYDNSMAGPSYMPSSEHAFTKHADAKKHIGGLLAGMGGVSELDTETGGNPGQKTGENPQGVQSSKGKPKRVRDPQRNPSSTGSAWRSGQGLRQGQAAALPKGVKSKAPNQRSYGAGVD